MSAALLEDHIALALRAIAADRRCNFFMTAPPTWCWWIWNRQRKKRLELLRQFKENPPRPLTQSSRSPPQTDTAGKLRAFELGAIDCLSKPLQPELLRARLLAALKTKRQHDELARHNHDLMKARLAAEAAARAKSDFLAAMSHEIRTPMNGVIAMVSLLLETPLTADQRSYLETIHTSSESLLTIINDILDFSKIEAGKMELDSRPFDLRDVHRGIARPACPQGRRKKSRPGLSDWTTASRRLSQGDSHRLRQVLVNLLSNAIKFTDEGDVFVRVKLLVRAAGERDRKPIALHLHFPVRDTGIGIPPDRLARLFKPFMQADVSTAQTLRRHGTGTGHQQAAGGIDGRQNVGRKRAGRRLDVSFHRKFPGGTAGAARRNPPAQACRPAGFDCGRQRHQPPRARRADGKMGHDFRIAETVQQALELLRRGGRFDLAIVDLHLPGMDGLALASEIHKLPGTAMLPLVLAHAAGHTRRHAADDAHLVFAHTVTKPVKPAQFCAALERALFSPKAASAAGNTGRIRPSLAERLPLRILLVDDNAINQKVAVRILRQLGYQPDLADNGREALDALDQQTYDLVFHGCDDAGNGRAGGHAPHPRTAEDSGRLIRITSRIIIVAMTAHAMQGDREKCLAAGMDDYLAKPIRPADVRDMH